MFFLHYIVLWDQVMYTISLTETLLCDAWLYIYVNGTELRVQKLAHPSAVI